MKESKKAIYARYGIEFKSGKIYHKEFGYIAELLVDGNQKIGKGCFHFSTLPTNKVFHVVINGKEYDIKGTCVCDCVGCYATKGNYRFSSVKNALAIRTWLIRNDLDFVYRAITAQIEADGINLLRIHASGDFDSMKYAFIWRKIALENPEVKMWTYTKVKQFEHLFDGIANANIVKSIISGCGYNFGHCEYIRFVYEKLTAENKSVYICKCGVDKEQHCVNCGGCSRNEYVLFIEHSTEYNAEKDPAFIGLKAIIENQSAELA